MKVFKNILMVIGGIVLFLIVLVVIIILVVSLTSKKMVCKSSEGNITLNYNNKTIVGYVATGSISYNLSGQKAYAEKVGIDTYLDEFAAWFKENTSGTCNR